MTDWTAGYVADIGYTFGYYTELNPHRLRLAFLNAGLEFPEVADACELGFGQGLSANIHAAASQTRWFGTDFNPSQAQFAQTLGKVSGADARFFDQSFEEFCSRSDLPDFDYIGLHGIWSWVSDRNRTVIVDFIRRKLKVGGVLYISYNTQPGWAAMTPMRDLLTEHSEVMGVRGQGIVSRIDGALAFAEKMLATNPVYARANPQVAETIQKIKEQDRHYLAHEYFNRDWLPMPFSRMAEWLAPTKLSFACSAFFLDHVEPVNLTDEQVAFLKEIPDGMFRESVRDFMVNHRFRRDYWVKGGRRLSPLAHAEALRAEQVVLVKPIADISLKITSPLGEATLQKEVYDPILEVLSDYKAKSLRQLEQAVKGKGLVFSRVLQAVMVLAGTGALEVKQDDAISSKATKQSEKLNVYLCDKARGSGDVGYLASPVTGGGVLVGRSYQLFMLARMQGQKTPAEWAAFAWQVLAAQGQKIVKEGRTLETSEENLSELNAQAKTFSEKHLPLLRELKVV
ncbi:MAG: class I SAM-dependent methyltransferase [Thermodesulfobacteriota bacterium]